MELVVDTNVLISALVKPSMSRNLICSHKLVLYAPEHIISETLAHKEEIIGKSGVSELKFKALIAVLLSRINIVPENEFEHLIAEALELAKHPEDSPFLALSLLKNIPLWSNDKRLKQQSKIRVFSTLELFKEFSL